MAYYLDPADFQMASVAELADALLAMVPEKAATQAKAVAAIQYAVEQDEISPAYTIRVEGEIDGNHCEYLLPCCGSRMIRVEIATECDDCWRDTNYMVNGPSFRLSRYHRGNARFTLSARNHLTSDMGTIRQAVEGAEEFEIYLEGQPRIPSYGVVRICGEPWIYRCKSHTTFSTDGVEQPIWGIDSGEGMLSTDTIETPDMSSAGSAAPRGTHTVLYAQRVAECGSLPMSDMVTRLPGVKVEFPVILADGNHKQYLLALAASYLYRVLIGSCTAERDIQRLTAMEQRYQAEYVRLRGRSTKPVGPRVIRHGFKTKLPLGTRWTSPYRHTWRGVSCCW